MAYLIIHQPGKEPIRYPLNGTTTLGRALDCDIYLNDTMLSRRHCSIEPASKDRKTWAAHDLESRNGTRIGGRQISRQELNDGDLILVGLARIQFHAVGFVDKRPKSPHSETSAGSSDQTLVPNVASPADPSERPLPTVKIPIGSGKPEMRSSAKRPPTPNNGLRKEALPFRRAPAHPVVEPRTMDPQRESPHPRKRAILIGCVIAAGMATVWVAWALLR